MVPCTEEEKERGPVTGEGPLTVAGSASAQEGDTSKSAAVKVANPQLGMGWPWCPEHDGHNCDLGQYIEVCPGLFNSVSVFAASFLLEMLAVAMEASQSHEVEYLFTFIRSLLG